MMLLRSVALRHPGLGIPPTGVPGDPEPPPSGLLTYAPPDGWESYTERVISTSGGVITLNDSLDYRLVWPATPVLNTVTLKGGRNVVSIGGQIQRDTVTWNGAGPGANEAYQTGLRIYKSDTWTAGNALNNGRIVHIEGLLTDGYYLSDGLIVNAPEASVRYQAFRTEIGMWYRDSGEDGVGSPHPDGIQPWGGVGWLFVDRGTILATGQALMLKPDFNEPNQGHMEFRRLNVREQDNADTEYNDPAAPYPRPVGRTPRYWWWTDGEEGGVRLDPGTVWFDHPVRTFAGDNIFWPEGGPVGSDGTGTYASPTHSVGLDGTGAGYVYEGDPPDGDYVSAGVAGIGYVSPGYSAEPAPPPTFIAGVGSASTSLVSDPRTVDGTDGTIVDGTAALQAALSSAVSGQKFRLRGGTYAPSSPFTCPVDNVTISRYGDERVLFDGGNLGGTQDGVNGLSLIHVEGRANQHWRGMIVQGAGPNRGVIHVLNSTSIKVDRMILRDNLGEGVQIYGSDDCTIQDVVSVITALNNGARTGTNAPDCFSITANVGDYSYRTRVIRSFGAFGQDDCLDNFRGFGTVIEDSAMYKGGYHRDGTVTVGDGGNFKTGGDPDSSSIVRGSVAVGARISNFFHNTLSPSGSSSHDYSYLSSYDAGYVGIDAGDQAGSDIRNSISHVSGSGPLFYLRGSSTPTTCYAGDPSYADLANLDLSLANGSPCLGAASDGDQQGASEEAYRLLYKWANVDVMSL